MESDRRGRSSGRMCYVPPGRLAAYPRAEDAEMPEDQEKGWISL
jgi:hypothetical protein